MDSGLIFDIVDSTFWVIGDVLEQVVGGATYDANPKIASANDEREEELLRDVTYYSSPGCTTRHTAGNLSQRFEYKLSSLCLVQTKRNRDQ